MEAPKEPGRPASIHLAIKMTYMTQTSTKPNIMSKSTETTAPKTKEPKRLILVATNKGGVGKSTAVIHIADHLHEKGIPFVAFDPDHANASFARFFQKEDGGEAGNMRMINIADDSSLDQITRVFDTGEANLAIVDGVGAQQETFLNWIEEIGLFERAAEMDLKITFVLVIDEDKDTVDQALTVAGRAENKVDYLVIKNLKNTSETRIYDASPARKMLVGMLKAREITFPKLKGNLVTVIQNESLRLSQAEKSDKVYINDRFRITGYRKQVTAALDSVEEILTA